MGGLRSEYLRRSSTPPTQQDEIRTMARKGTPIGPNWSAARRVRRHHNDRFCNTHGCWLLLSAALVDWQVSHRISAPGNASAALMSSMDRSGGSADQRPLGISQDLLQNDRHATLLSMNAGSATATWRRSAGTMCVMHVHVRLRCQDDDIVRCLTLNMM